jgi:hypothetical protein
MCGGDCASGQEGGGNICCCNRAQLFAPNLIIEVYFVKVKKNEWSQ